MCTHIVDTEKHSKRPDQPAMCGANSGGAVEFFSWNPRTSFEESPNKYYCDKCIEAYRAKYEKPITKSQMEAYVEERLTQFGSVMVGKLKPKVPLATGVHIRVPGGGDGTLCQDQSNYWNAFATWEGKHGNYTYCPECERIAKMMKAHGERSVEAMRNKLADYLK